MPDQGTDSFLDKLVGDGAKYADAENLAKGYTNLEAHVETIKQEKLELEEKLGIQAKQETHLETIVNLLKPTEKEPEPKPVPKEPDPVPEPKIEPTPKEDPIPVNVTLNMNQFAKDAVDKYGDAKVVGEHLQSYIGGDADKAVLVEKLMQTDPSALLRILPDADKGFSPSGGTVKTNTPSTYSGMTYTEAMQTRKENPTLFNSPAFQMKMIKARTDAKALGVDFDKT